MARTTVLNHLGFPVGPDVTDRDGVDVVDVPRDGSLPDDATGDVLLTFPWACPTLEAVLARGVEWVHVLATGIDAFPLELVGPDQALTCSRGASAIPISEWVLAHMLAAAQRLPEVWLDEPPPDQWDTPEQIDRLHQRTVVIVGLGGIGLEVARRCLAFGMRVVAVRRTGAPSPVPGVDVVTDLASVVGTADHLVLAAPATAATHHLVDAELLAAVEPGLHLVNVARGALVDQDALRAALDDGRVALASLDTVDPEPLPAGHWLYDHARVRLTPHISWRMPGAIDVLAERFTANLDRWRAGEPLDGAIDRTEGY